jgi:hypothetical protein
MCPLVRSRLVAAFQSLRAAGINPGASFLTTLFLDPTDMLTPEPGQVAPSGAGEQATANCLPPSRGLETGYGVVVSGTHLAPWQALSHTCGGPRHSGIAGGVFFLPM